MALGLMNLRNVKVEQILSYELAPVPTSMFEKIDGCAILWVFIGQAREVCKTLSQIL